MEDNTKIIIKGLISTSIIPMIDSLLNKMEREAGLEKLEKILSRDELNELFKSLEEKVADDRVSSFDIDESRKLYNISRERVQLVYDLHEDVFHYFFLWLNTANTIFDNFLKHISSSNKNAPELQHRDIVNITLFGNLCRMSNQIGVEMLNGYPDGAMILWRTFYEYCVVAVFLLKNNSNDLAKRFIDFSMKDTKRKTESYMKRHRDLGLSPISQESVDQINKNYEEIKNKYEKDFFKSDYSWAKPFLGNDVNFVGVEDASGFSKYRPIYIWASAKVHPTFNGITDFRNESNTVILQYIIERDMTRLSLSDPANLTLAIFSEVMDHFLFQYSGQEYEININIFKKIYERFKATISKEKVEQVDAGRPGL